MSKYSIQDIFQKYGLEYIKTHKLSKEQWKVYNAIISCKTASLGIHTITCEECGETHTALNSCRNRHCPNCQSYAREKWIEKQSSLNVDVLMCNPNLVKTGLDLIDFTTIIFYQIGYNIFTMRQASRRSWRLSQKKDVEVYFMFYRDTVQEKAISLMASKMQASMALEGKFSEEGLRAMADNEDLLSQIANSVVEGIKDTVDVKVFTSTKNNSDTSKVEVKSNKNRKTLQELLVNTVDRRNLSYLSNVYNKKNKNSKTIKSVFNNDINIIDLYKSVI